jgi:general secretion pathway protein J
MQYKTSPQSCKRAMTLIEVVIALALFSLVAVFTVSNTSVGLKIKQKLSGSSDYYHNIRTALRHMDRDISLAYHAYQDTKQGELNRQLLLTTSPKDALTYTTGSFFKGEKNKLLFSSSSHQRLYKNTTETDTSEVAYYLEEDNKNQGLFNLYKRQSAFIDEDFDHGGSLYLIANGIESIEFRYLSTETKNGDEYWVDKWDSTAGDFVSMFPLAVEVTLVFSPIKQAEKKFKVVQKIKILNPNNTGPVTSATSKASGG